MRFHLVYSGLLRASGNSAKPDDVLKIRQQLSDQLKVLWATHPSLQVLWADGARPTGRGVMLGPSATPRQLAAWQPDMYEDLILPLTLGDCNYQPLVRKSLDLSCELQILFLRQQDPGALVSQGGDIDNRIKLLLDALRMPTKDEQDRSKIEKGTGLYCLMESDTLVSRLDVDTDRLLFPQTDKDHEVHLIIGVKINVLRVGSHNICLL